MQNVLIVDDDSDLLNLYKQAFLNTGVEVTASQNLTEVEDLINSDKYDVIITDLLFPGSDTLPIIRLIRQEGGVNAKTPILVLTNLDNSEKIKKALEYGANVCLQKATQTPSGIVKTAQRLSNESASNSGNPNRIEV